MNHKWCLMSDTSDGASASIVVLLVLMMMEERWKNKQGIKANEMFKVNAWNWCWCLMLCDAAWWCCFIQSCDLCCYAVMLLCSVLFLMMHSSVSTESTPVSTSLKTLHDPQTTDQINWENGRQMKWNNFDHTNVLP